MRAQLVRQEAYAKISTVMNTFNYRSKKSGFTIVELLIVIVVIGILAAITIVAFNGVQARANISSINSSLGQVNKAIKAYEAINGTYPSTGGSWVLQGNVTKDTFIPGLVPDVVASLPRAAQWAGTPTFYYRSNGTDYKLLYLYASAETMPSSAASSEAVQRLLDTTRTTRGWGHWSTGGASF